MPVSPGIYTNALTFVEYAKQLGLTKPLIVGGATKGALNAPTRIRSEPELIREFGDPTAVDYGVLGAIEALKSTPEIMYMRVANGAAVATKAVLGEPGTQSQGSIVFSANPLNTDSLALNDGTVALTFEFDTDGGVTATRHLVTIGTTKEDTAFNLAQVANAIPGVTMVASVDPNNAAHVIFTRNAVGTASNATVADTEAGTNMAVNDFDSGATVVTTVLATGSANGTTAGVTFSAKSPGTWGNSLVVVVRASAFNHPDATAEPYDLDVYAPLTTNGPVQLVEQYVGVQNDSTLARFVETVLSQGLTSEVAASKYVVAVVDGNGIAPNRGSFTLVNGRDGLLHTGIATQGAALIANNPVATDLLTIPAPHLGAGNSTTFEFGPLVTGDYAVTIGATAVATATNLVSSINAANLAAPAAVPYTAAVDLYNTSLVILTSTAMGAPVGITDVTVTLTTGGDVVPYDWGGGSLHTVGVNTTTLATGQAVNAGLDAGDYIGTTLLGVATGLQEAKNSERYEFNVLMVPGVSDPTVFTSMIDVCTTRQDCIAVLDPPLGLLPGEVVDWHNGVNVPGVTPQPTAALDSEWAATFHSWTKHYSEYLKVDVWIPPSVAAVRAFAKADRDVGPWQPAAGKVFGFVEADDLEVKPQKADRDLMVTGGNAVNPISEFGGQFAILGNRTLLRTPGPGDRLHIMRMLVHVMKIVTTSVEYLHFAPNDPTTWRNLEQSVSKALEPIKAQRGLAAFAVKVVDEMNANPTLVDDGVVSGKVFLTPVAAAEVITLDFALQAASAAFTVS